MNARQAQSKDSSFEGFYNKALKFLSYRPRSEKEVHDNLTKKSSSAKASEGQRKASEEMVNLIIKKLKEQRFLDDREFAKWWIEQRTLVKPMGKRLIKLELTKKGIDKELIDEIFNDTEKIVHSELELARKLVQRKIEKFKNEDRQTVYRRLGGFLSRRGFNYDTIKKAIDEALKEDYNSF